MRDMVKFTGAAVDYIPCDASVSVFACAPGLRGRTPRGIGLTQLEYAYKRRATKGFEATVAAVEQTMLEHGLVVDRVHDLHATVAAKGFAISPLRIYEFSTGEGFWAAPPPGLDLVLPCRLSVCLEQEDVIVAAIRPSLAVRIFPEAHLDAVAERIETTVLRVIDEAVVR